MTYEVTYKVGKIPFIFSTQSISEAFDAVKSIIKNESISFPNQSEAFDNYFSVLSTFQGEASFFENHIFSIEKTSEG